MKKSIILFFLAAATLSFGQSDTEASMPEMVKIEGGSFILGASVKDKGADKDEYPQNIITLNTFYMSKFEVTVYEWKAFVAETNHSMPTTPTWGWDESYPMSSVSWFDAIDYCNWLSKKHGLQAVYSKRGSYYSCNFNANGYRLPTEAEWEYAAKGGQKSKKFKFVGSDSPDRMAWSKSNSGDRPHTVGTRYANELGIFDLNGNVWEWCWDIYDESYYRDIKKGLSPDENPQGALDGDKRVLKGGSWDSKLNFLRPTNKVPTLPTTSYDFFGLRIVKNAD